MTEIEKLKTENERLREWIREQGEHSNTCTFDVLKEICDGCKCPNKLKEKNK